MRAALQKSRIEFALFASEDFRHNRLEVVVDAPTTQTAKKIMRSYMRIQNHLHLLQRIGNDETHPAVAKAKMGDASTKNHSINRNFFAAPVELKGFTLTKTQRNIHCRQRRLIALPFTRIAAHRTVASRIPFALQLLVQRKNCSPLGCRYSRFRFQQRLKRLSIPFKRGVMLFLPMVRKTRCFRPDNLANRFT